MAIPSLLSALTRSWWLGVRLCKGSILAETKTVNVTSWIWYEVDVSNPAKKSINFLPHPNENLPWIIGAKGFPREYPGCMFADTTLGGHMTTGPLGHMTCWADNTQQTTFSSMCDSRGRRKWQLYHQSLALLFAVLSPLLIYRFYIGWAVRCTWWKTEISTHNKMERERMIVRQSEDWEKVLSHGPSSPTITSPFLQLLHHPMQTHLSWFMYQYSNVFNYYHMIKDFDTYLQSFSCFSVTLKAL